MTASTFPPPPKVRESRFDDWMFRFWKGFDRADSSVTAAITGYVNVRSFGATGDGTTDDTTAVLAAISSAASSGRRRIYFPAGTYRLTSALTISGDMFLFGDGRDASILKVDHSGNGINYSGNIATRDTDCLTIEHLALKSNNSSAGAALYGAWTITGSGAIVAQPTHVIQHVAIGSASSAAAFTYGINFWGSQHGVINDVSVYGYESGTTASGSYGILLNGGNSSGAWTTSTAYSVNTVVTQSNLTYRCLIAHTSGTFATDLAAGKWVYINTTDCKIRDCTIHYCETGIYCLDCEGIHIQQNTILSCLDGIVFDTTQTIGKPYADITGNHMNVGRYGVRMREMTQFIVADNLIYGDQNTPLSGTSFIGVYVDSGSMGSGVETQSIVRDNIVLMVAETGGGYSTANYGYAVYGGSGTVESVLFKGNKSQGCDTLIYLDSSSTKVVVLDDNIGTDGATWSDNGTYNSTPYGAYTPTPYAITNIGLDSDIDPYEATWTRTGNIVTVYGDVDIDPTAANAATTFRLSLPVPTDMGASTQLSGVITPNYGVNTPSGAASGHLATSPDRVQFDLYVTFTSPSRFSYCYRYRVS